LFRNCMISFSSSGLRWAPIVTVVDGVFWYTKHVRYTLVWIWYGTNPPLGTLII
jgi:hypothetical protein